ncbi:sensor histidine kinase [soil metagenome]
MNPYQADIHDPAFLIADAAGRFRHSRDWTEHIGPVMEQVGEGLGVSRVYLFQVHELESGGLGQTCRGDWASPGLKPLAGDERNVSEPILENDETMLKWAERRRRGEIIAGHTRDLAGYLREDFEYQQIKSYISFPIWVNGNWWGHIGFDDCVREREWTISEISVLRTLGYLISDAIELSASSLVMSEATRLAMLNTAPEGVIVFDEAGAILEFNPAAERMFGLSQATLLGQRIADTLIPPRRRPGFRILMRKLQQGRAARVLGKHTETEALNACGKNFPVELAITEIRRGGRRLFVAYARDLTERKRTEAQVERQRAALHQSEKLTALGSLLAGVAHELNNPLSVVLGRAIMLEEQARDSEQRERLKKLREAAERCAKVSKTFLAMARQTPAERKPIVLNKAITTALDLVAYQLRSGGVRVKLELDEKLPEATADFDQMVQVFVNLFVNAEHAMRDTAGDRVMTITTRASGSLVHADVADTGPGVREDLRSRIFEPFFTTKSVGAGTGMGLAVSFGIMSAHAGTLELLSRPDQRGACFRVALQIEKTVRRPAAALAEVEASRIGKRVLIVDDEPEIVELLRDILEAAGHSVDHAEHGLEALVRLGAAEYHAIFCDLRMPGLDGRGLRRRLVADRPAYAKRMIFVTGDLLGSGADRDGIDGCPVIEKPFYAGTVLAELSRIAD